MTCVVEMHSNIQNFFWKLIHLVDIHETVVQEVTPHWVIMWVSQRKWGFVSWNRSLKKGWGKFKPKMGECKKLNTNVEWDPDRDRYMFDDKL